VAAWIFRIAHRTVANELRDRRPVRSLDFFPLVETQNPTMSETVLDAVILTEERQRLTRLLASLPAEQRELLALKAAGQLSAREIGAVLGKSEGAVRVALHRTIQQVRAALRAPEDDANA
jgi:RNA polymerase sigma-70 factor (ECF subfamily)